MEDNNLKKQFSADLLEVVSKVLSEQKVKLSYQKMLGSHNVNKNGSFHRSFPTEYDAQKYVTKNQGKTHDELAKIDEETEQVDEKRGLWDNIHAKRKRIKSGSGERMRKPGSEGAPTAAALKASQTEEVELDEKHGGADYALYHKSYTNAVDHALSHHGKDGLTVSDDDKFHHIGIMSKKPSEGNTTTLNMPAKHTATGKNHRIHIQVYNKGGTHPYELNTYSSKNSVRDDKREASFDEEVSLAEKHTVKYAMKHPSKGGKIAVAHYDSKTEAEKFLASVKKSGGNGILSSVKENVELGEGEASDKFSIPTSKMKKKLKFPGWKKAKPAFEETELEEKLIGKQTELDVDKDGKIEKSDFKKLRNKKLAAKMGESKAKEKAEDDEECECKEETGLGEVYGGARVTMKPNANVRNSGLPKPAMDALKAKLDAFEKKHFTKEEVELDESITDSDIEQLRKAYSGIKTVDPSSDSYKRLKKLLDTAPQHHIKKLAGANIPFVSSLAQNRVKSVKEESNLDEGRGRPRKDEEESEGSEADKNIMNQVRKAADSGMMPHKVTYADGSTHGLPRTHARAIIAKHSRMKPAEKEAMQSEIAKSHEHMMKHAKD
jgi:hypothetical protein